MGQKQKVFFDKDAPPSKKEKEDEILKEFMKEYNIEGIKETMDETAQIPENIYFFMVHAVINLKML